MACIPLAADASAGIDLRAVTKSFQRRGSRSLVLENCSFAIEPNRLTVLLGPSGSGKTTLVRLIAGYEAPDSGTILLEGRPIRGPGPERMVVFQETALFPWMNLIDNVAYGPLQAGRLRQEALSAAADMLRRVGLSGFERRYPAQLSGGMQRRAEVIRALINRPRVLLLDEPFRGLDHMTRGLMQEFLLQLFDQEATTMLFVTSEVDEAVFLADRIIVLASRPKGVRAMVEVPLPRPRDFSLTSHPEYGEIEAEVLDLVTS
jgi:NitT/TauT family transport system ATP-binding protein